MAFPFYCPQGHLLQGEPEQAGQPCQCPQCGSTFLVPQANAAGSGDGPQTPGGDLPMPAFEIPPPGSSPAPARGGDLPMPAFQIPPSGSIPTVRGGDLPMPAFQIPPPGRA